MNTSAPGKLILSGEHAVVYRRPAIAIPVAGVRAYVQRRPAEVGAGICFEAPQIGQNWNIKAAPENPLSQLAEAVLRSIGVSEPDLVLSISSEIPIASGMGSGAAIATAIVRSLAAHAGWELPVAEVSALVYESEKRFHGTPSGIDNTVVAFERPIWFERRGDAERQLPALIEPIRIALPLNLLIGDTGIRSETKQPVGEVRKRWQAQPDLYEAFFDAIGAIARHLRIALADGDLTQIGQLMNQNQQLLRAIGVSSPELDQLIQAANQAGALGAKLSGAGWGGVMIALIKPEDTATIRTALFNAGAQAVLETTILRAEG